MLESLKGSMHILLMGAGKLSQTTNKHAYIYIHIHIYIYIYIIISYSWAPVSQATSHPDKQIHLHIDSPLKFVLCQTVCTGDRSGFVSSHGVEKAVKIKVGPHNSLSLFKS
jgi:hypothetical protein